MRLLQNATLLVLAALLPATLPPRSAAGRSPESLEGDWQTVIASPKRPWIFLVRFKPAGAAWTGTMSVEGLAEFPLRDVQVESTRVHFQLPPELDSLVFEGTLGSEGIVGHVPELGQMTPTRLTRIVPLPAPRNRIEAWQQDLDDASVRLSAYDRSFTPRAREAFRKTLADLKHSLPRRNDAEILVALSRAVAQSGNAHTRLRLDPTSQGSFGTEFPIRIWWFSDGPHVVRAATEYRRALRARLVAINGHDLSKVGSDVTRLFAGNAAWAQYLTPIYLASPDLLYGLGFLPSMTGASFTFEDARGARFDLWVRPEPISETARPAEFWQELSPLQATGSPPWTTALAAPPDSLPLYLRHPEKAYWFQFKADTGLLYFQFNRSDNDETGPTFREFGDSLMTFIDGHAVQNVVVDLRFNSGGNLDVAKAFLRDLARQKTINRRGRLFVIVGRCTFSAGLYHAAQLKQFTQAMFVGEPVGDRLDYWAEGGEIVLPNSRAVICYANGFHRYSGREYPEYRPYYEELNTPSLAPDISAPMSSAEYFSGRDPALEAIEARVGRK
jgi:hypothetical protein